jgi:hypothetical protein
MLNYMLVVLREAGKKQPRYFNSLKFLKAKLPKARDLLRITNNLPLSFKLTVAKDPLFC